MSLTKFCCFTFGLKLFAKHKTPPPSRLDDGTIRMYYTGHGKDGSTAIGVAKLLSYETNASWVREQASFTFATVAD